MPALVIALAIVAAFGLGAFVGAAGMAFYRFGPDVGAPRDEVESHDDDRPALR